MDKSTQRESTNTHDNDGTIIYVDDLVIMATPVDTKNPLIFKITKNGDFKRTYHSGSMSDGDPNYELPLSDVNVFRVVGNIEAGVDEKLLTKRKKSDLNT